MPDGTDLLRLSAIVKRWNGRTVLDRIDLVLRPGSFVRVKGANGAGKTTLLRIASGLIRPEEGDVSLHGTDPERERQAFLKSVGFLSAGDRGLYPRLSPRRHLELCADLALVPRGERDAAIASAIDQFTLAGFADRRAERLSSGQRQRVRLAVALIHRPTLMLLDEPATSLDDAGIEVLADAVQRHLEDGGAALWCAPSAVDPPIPFRERYVLEGGRLVPE